MIRVFRRSESPALLRRVRAAGACALLIVVGAGGVTGPDGRSGEDDFSSNTLSRYTATSDGGTPWTIVGGRLIGDGRGIQSVLIRKGAALKTGWVETTTSHADDSGLVVGYVDNDNYYLFTMRDDEAPPPRGERNLAVYQRIDGHFHEVWTRGVRWPRGTPRTFRFEMAGAGRLRVLMDGEPMAEVPLKPNGGMGFGLRHYGDDRTWKSRFDVFRWEIEDED